MEVSKNEPEEENGNTDILAKEVESWKDFRCALREENALLFNGMLSECRQIIDCIRSVISKDVYYSAESLFLLLILQQQRC
jgi:hypothetical protein